jgi:PPOX class probable F420-dependent enzyme
MSTLEDAVAFARTTRQSVLTTIRRNGRPQLSNVVHTVADDGIIRVSITADRAKYHNLSREPWAALYVTSANFFAYAVLECDVTLSSVAAQPGDEAVDELIAVYRAVSGEHDDWDEYRAAMVSDRRVVARLAPTRAYGMVPRSPGTAS